MHKPRTTLTHKGRFWLGDMHGSRFFFVTSGFLLAQKMEQQDQTEKPGAFCKKSFWNIIRRCIRFLPMYWLALLWEYWFERHYVRRLMKDGSALQISFLIQEIFAVHGWWSNWQFGYSPHCKYFVQDLTDAINNVDWFVSVLLLWTIISPLVTYNLSMVNDRLTLQILLFSLAIVYPVVNPICAFCPFWDMFLPPAYIREYRPPMSLALPSTFVSGMVLAKLLKTTRSGPQLTLPLLLLKKWLGLCGLLLFILPMCIIPAGQETNDCCADYWQLLLCVPSVLLLLWGLSDENDWLNVIVSHKASSWAGQASYGIYLLASPVWYTLKDMGLSDIGSYDAQIAVWIGVLIPVAFSMHHLFEAPLIAMLGRLLDWGASSAYGPVSE